MEPLLATLTDLDFYDDEEMGKAMDFDRGLATADVAEVVDEISLFEFWLALASLESDGEYSPTAKNAKKKELLAATGDWQRCLELGLEFREALKKARVPEFIRRIPSSSGKVPKRRKIDTSALEVLINDIRGVLEFSKTMEEIGVPEEKVAEYRATHWGVLDMILRQLWGTPDDKRLARIIVDGCNAFRSDPPCPNFASTYKEDYDIAEGPFNGRLRQFRSRSKEFIGDKDPRAILRARVRTARAIQAALRLGADSVGTLADLASEENP